MARTAKKPGRSATRRGRSVPWRGVAVAAVAVAAVGALLVFDEPPPGVEFPDQGNRHISALGDPHEDYNSSPPSSGPHLGVVADWGVASDVVPPELFVHNLEDAGVVLAYDCPDGCPDLIDGLTSYVEDNGGRLLLTPYTGISYEGTGHRAAAVAWTRVFYFDDFDATNRSELDLFVGLYEGIDHHVGN